MSATDADGVKREIVAALSGLRDHARSAVAVQGVVTREQVYTDAYATESPDIVVNFGAGYRVSWATALGWIPYGDLEDNVKRWGGDHIIDPALVPGTLFMNHEFRCERAGLIDLAPTILAALGAPKGKAMEGESLLRSSGTA